jgi:hypothetical protein
VPNRGELNARAVNRVDDPDAGLDGGVVVFVLVTEMDFIPGPVADNATALLSIILSERPRWVDSKCLSIYLDCT